MKKNREACSVVGWFTFVGVCAISVLRTGFLRFVDLSTKKFDLIRQIIVFYYNGRFAIPAKLMFWGNILFPAITLLWSGFWLIRKRKTGVSTLLPGLLVCTVLNTVMAAMKRFVKCFFELLTQIIVKVRKCKAQRVCVLHFQLAGSGGCFFLMKLYH